MDERDLRHIKVGWHTSIYCGTDGMLFDRAVRDIDILCAALEAAQQELADAVEMLAEEGFSVTDEKGAEYVTLRAQLAEAEGTISSWQVENAELKSFITDLRAQLTASVELCNIREEQISELLKESEASQAEVKRLRRHPTPMGREPANNWRGKA